MCIGCNARNLSIAGKASGNCWIVKVNSNLANIKRCPLKPEIGNNILQF